jgi:hypothetical protein
MSSFCVPQTARHGEYVEMVAPYGTHLLVRSRWPPVSRCRPHDPRRGETGKTMVINWPLAWYRRMSPRIA